MENSNTNPEATTLAPSLPDDLISNTAAVLRYAERLKIKLATAESCTGGMLASLLTDIEGMSHVFDRGFITYGDNSKSELLGIAPDLIQLHGAVSEEVARRMAAGALKRSEASIVLAVTGFTGSAGSTGEAGLVHFACATRNGKLDHKRCCFGNRRRGEARISTLRVALTMLLVALERLDLVRGNSQTNMPPA